MTFFRGRHVVVTGGGRGIGRALSLEFGRLGAVVHVVSRSQTAEAVCREILDAGGSALDHVGSVTDESFVRALVKQVESTGAHVDVVVNAAAVIGPWGRFRDSSMVAFEDVLRTNLYGTCNLMRWTLPAMEAAGFGRIINFAGGGAAYSYPMFSPYAVSKVAVVRLTEIVADEITAPNVTANVIAPGAVETDMLAVVRSRGGEVRTVTDMSEPVGLVTFLAGPDSAHITGRFIHVRDDWENPATFRSNDLFKLRRTELR